MTDVDPEKHKGVQRQNAGDPATTEPISAGARWVRVDLHLHSPGVSSFVLPPGIDLKGQASRQALVSQFVDQLQAEGISLCALTDYNGVRQDWFLPIRDGAARHGITILPGCEISFKTGKYGLHVLAVFAADVDPLSINSFLQALDRDAATPLLLADRSHRDIDPRDNIAEALRDLRQRFDCLLIVPHPDQDNGLCKSLQTSDAARLLLEVSPDAIEHCPDSQIQKLRSTGLLPKDFFANFALVEFSDPKRLEQIGTRTTAKGERRATYLKLSSYELGALRLALHDPETRLVCGEVPPANHPRIRRMDVTGSGYLGNIVILWNDDLNVLIGGRGAGKSAVLEVLRYALDLEPYSEQSYRGELVHHALGSGGRVSVTLELPVGTESTRAYEISRVWGEQSRVYELSPKRSLAIAPSDLFGPSGVPAIFGQREIYAVSGSDEYRVRLLDDLIGEEASSRANQVREATEALRTNARHLSERKRRLLRREEYRQRLKTIEFEISVYEKHGVAGKLRSLTALRSDAQRLRASLQAVASAKRSWSEQRDDLISPLSGASHNLRSGESANRSLLGEAAAAVDSLHNRLLNLMDDVQSAFDNTINQLTAILNRWQNALAPLEDELNRVKQEAKAEALDPDRLVSLSEERTALAPQIVELDRVDKEVEQLRALRTNLMDVVRETRLAEHRLRREQAESIENLLEGRLRLAVEFKGQKADYKRNLLALLKGSGVSADAVERLGLAEATDGLALSEAVRAGTAVVQNQFGLTLAMAERLVKWFTDDEARLFELETFIPGDSLRVELRVDDQIRPLEKLSPGQRATAVLLLLFALKGRMLILDQPEDDLDNRFVYEDVVQILRAQKGMRPGDSRRQIIAATHNPNIPVIGDAELVLALESRDNRARIVGRASIDHSEIRELIKSIMEGGEEAFHRRAEKYGGI